MSVDDFDELDEQMEQRIEEYVGMLQRNASVVDALRAENAKLLEEIGRLFEQRRDLALAVIDTGWTGEEPQDSCTGCGVYRRDLAAYRHFVECPVSLAERVLAEKVTQYCTTTADNAPYVAQDGAHG